MAATTSGRRRHRTDRQVGWAATMRGRSLPVPAPIKTMRYYDAMTEPAEVVVDTGSSTPPSDSSYSPPALYHPYAASPPSDSSSSPPAFYHPYAASPPSDSSSSPPAFYHPSAAARPSPPRVEVRPVWRHNFAQEAALIESLLPRFRYAAVDTEYPGTVHRPAGPAYLLTAGKRYALLKANVDELDLIQLGLTLFDDRSDSSDPITWEFNLREFDPLRHRHAPESVAMLRARGADFHRARRHGVHAAVLGARLRKWLRAGLGRAGVVTFSGGYDLAYLVKAMYGSGYKLPASAAEFEGVSRALLRRNRNIFDVKQMARCCPRDLRGGLGALAEKLGVARAGGEAHQAGSDSLLTCHTFLKMKERYFQDEASLSTVAGLLTDITAAL